MTFKYSLIIIFCILMKKNIFNCARNQSDIESIAELYNFSAANGSLMTAKSLTNKSELSNITDLENKTDLYHVQNKNLRTKAGEQVGLGSVADLYYFPLTSLQNNRNTTDNKNVSRASLGKNKTNFYLPKPSNIVDIGELYYFSSALVMGMFNCSFDNTINITNYPKLPNGSYVYDNQTTIPDNLVGNYDYKIQYDGTKLSVPLHKRACICRLKPCITLCSDSIIDFYQNAAADGIDEEFLKLFSIPMTLSNKTVVSRNIAKDFAHIVLDDFCEQNYRLSPEKDKQLGWTLLENGNLLRHSDQQQLNKTEYCFELYIDQLYNNTYYLINPLNCAKLGEELTLTGEIIYWTQVCSIPFFLLTIIAYCCLPELRNVHGKCFLSYLTCLTTSYSIISYINLSQQLFQQTFGPMPCLLMGYFNHYMQLSQYTWLGIICFDTWKSLSDLTYKSSYHKYAMYGYHLPLLMTFLTFLAQNSKLDDALKPGINEYRCGLEVNKWGASIYLYGPCLIILICCLIFFILTSKIINENDKDAIKVKELQHECPKARYTLYLRLFLMMGLSWFLDIMSYILNMFYMENLSRVIDNINSLQGLYIFVNFIGRRRVRDIIRKRFFNVERLY